MILLHHRNLDCHTLYQYHHHMQNQLIQIHQLDKLHLLYQNMFQLYHIHLHLLYILFQLLLS